MACAQWRGIISEFPYKKAAAISDAAAFLVQMILLLGVHGALPAILAQTLKLDGAVNLGEQGVVLTDAHVDTGMDVGASLANQNVAGQNELTVGTFLVEPPPLW